MNRVVAEVAAAIGPRFSHLCLIVMELLLACANTAL